MGRACTGYADPIRVQVKDSVARQQMSDWCQEDGHEAAHIAWLVSEAKNRGRGRAMISSGICRRRASRRAKAVSSITVQQPRAKLESVVCCIAF